MIAVHMLCKARTYSFARVLYFFPFGMQRAEQDVQEAATLRVQLLQKQAQAWEQSAARLRSLQDAQRARIAQARQAADKVCVGSCVYLCT